MSNPRVFGRRYMPMLAILSGLIHCNFSAHSEELVFVNDVAPYCPYALCGKGKDGFVIDIVKAVYRAEGYSVKIENVPWSRALLMVQEGDADGILNVVKESAPKLLYPKTEVAQILPVVFSLKANPWRYDGVASFKKIRLGLIQGYGYAEIRPDFAKFLEISPEKIEWVSGEDPLLRIFRMMELGRVDATIEDVAVANFVLVESGMQGKFKVAGQFGKTKLDTFVAFNPKKQKSQLLAAIFEQGLVKLRQNGQMKTILTSYGMTDWKKSASN